MTISHDQRDDLHVGHISAEGHPRLVSLRGSQEVAQVIDEVIRVLRSELSASGAGILQAWSDGLCVRFDTAASLRGFVPVFVETTERLEGMVTLRLGLAAPRAHGHDEIVLRRVRQLCQLAAPGQIMMDASAARVLGGAGALEVHALGDVVAGNLAQPETLPGSLAAPLPEPSSGVSPWPSHAPRHGDGSTQWDGSASTFDLDSFHDDTSVTARASSSRPPGAAVGLDAATTSAGGLVTWITLIHAGRVLTHSGEDGPVELGRAVPLADPALRIMDATASGRHCRLELHDNRFWLHDTSTNGTLLFGDEGTRLRVHRGREPLPEDSGWIVLGRSRGAARVRYHVLQPMAASPGVTVGEVSRDASDGIAARRRR